MGFDDFLNNYKELCENFKKTFDILQNGPVKVYQEQIQKWEKRGNLPSKQPNDFFNLMNLLEKYQPQDKEHCKEGDLWQLCDWIYRVAEKGGSNIERSIRSTPKRGRRIMTKAIVKYSDDEKTPLDVSRTMDTFGCEIVTRDWKEHMNVLRNLFDMFRDEYNPATINLNGHDWKVHIQKTKFGVSKRDKEFRFDYIDDKIIFHAEHENDYICLEAILLPKQIKDLKKASHGIYDLIRETGQVVTDKLGLVGMQHLTKNTVEHKQSPISLSSLPNRTRKISVAGAKEIYSVKDLFRRGGRRMRRSSLSARLSTLERRLDPSPNTGILTEESLLNNVEEQKKRLITKYHEKRRSEMLHRRASVHTQPIRPTLGKAKIIMKYDSLDVGDSVEVIDVYQNKATVKTLEGIKIKLDVKHLKMTLAISGCNGAGIKIVKK